MINKAKQSQTSSLHLNNKAALGVALAALCFTPGLGVQRAFAAPAEVPVSAPAVQTVTGTVVDATGEPIIGASVKVKGSNTGAVTDIDGNFTLRANTGDEIEISYVGMTTQTFRVVEGQSSYNITLQDNTDALNEVVVVGYGTQKRVNLTGSVSSINASKIAETRPIQNLSQALAGMAAGVNVQSGSNAPGNDDATIRVRGVGTLNSAGPLVIVDGVETPISAVTPSDIESISVLKDAASASIYGSRAANGVILITTKKGEAGSVKVNYNGYVSFNSIRKTITPVSNYADYMELINEGYCNYYGEGYEQFSQDIIDEWRNGSDPLVYPNTDWIDETFKSSVSTNHSISMSGGTDKIRFFGSFDYNYNPGVLPNSDFNKYSGRVSVEADVRRWITLGINASGYYSTLEAGGIGGNGSSSNNTTIYNIFTYASATTPGMVFEAPDGRFGAMNNPEDDQQCAVNNPISRAHRTVGGEKNNQYRTRFYGTLRPFDGFTVTASYTYDFRNLSRRTKPNFVQGWNFRGDDETHTPVATYDSTGRTSVSYGNAKYLRNFADVVARYENKFFDKFDLGVMAGASQEQYKYTWISAGRQDLIDPDLWAIDAATAEIPSVGGYSTSWAMRSYFGRVNLAWDDKYLFEFNLRADGSSRFTKDNRWGYFPSASAAWRMDQEHFFTPIREAGLESFKLRFSYGSLGNNSIGNYETQALYDSGSGLNYSLNSAKQTGLAVVTIANPDLTWESTYVFDAGVDFGLFRNKLNVTADYFHKRTSNILIGLPAPAVHGTASLPKVNSAEVVNQGIEITANWNDRVGEFNYGANFNLTYVTNKVTKFKGKDEGGQSLSGTYLTWEGHPYRSNFMLEYDYIIQTKEQLKKVEDMIANAPIDEATNERVDPFAYLGRAPQMGDLMYKDINNDGVIDRNDRKIVGSGDMPKVSMGLNLTAEWRGIDLNVLLQAQFGGKRYFYTDYNRSLVRKGYQLNKEVCDGRWYEGRTDATYPRLLYYGDKYYNQASTFYLENTDYLKIRNIQIGYTLPKRWTNACELDRVRIYGTLENFITFTGYKGFDPEVSGMAYPSMRQATLGLNITF